jgi:uncharacterized LabA/DUF88 family protein
MNTTAYIDGANLEKSLSNIDYKRLHTYLSDKHKATKVYIFLGYLESQSKHYKLLKKAGYKIIFKEAVRLRNGKTKANVDAELILQAVQDYYEDKATKAILVSGDGDFTCLIDFWKKKRIKTNILPPQESSCSSLIKNRKVKITYLDQPKVYNQIKISKPQKFTFRKLLSTIFQKLKNLKK